MDDNLPLRKTLETCDAIIVVRSVFNDDSKYYPQAFLDGCLYKAITECMTFVTKDKQFLKEYNKIWEKVRNIMEKEFNSDPV